MADLSGDHVTGRPLAAALTYAGFRGSYGEAFHLLQDVLCRSLLPSSIHSFWRVPTRARRVGSLSYVPSIPAVDAGGGSRYCTALASCSPAGGATVWRMLLDPTDRQAARVARDGEPEPVHIEETDVAFAIDWKGHYRIDGAPNIFG